ncbi:MAG: S9 family peptidase [Crocinitomicaceae bacterium]|nr:S9 family peptidase [Crocinitomicaceae bacterium]|tara:strand:+ start:14323 stop:16353 length:2031 start_codon:yes stop_codon:yes gene_type:complete
MKKLIAFSIAVLSFGITFSQSVMTPELLWKLGRVGSPILSNDGSTLYFTIRYYDLDSNKGQSQIYSISLEGGELNKLTDLKGGVGNLMIGPNGSLNYASKGQIWELDASGISNQISNFVAPMGNLSYSPTGNRILGTITQKLQKQASDEYENYKKANVKIYDDLMFRHWDNWSNGKFSHPALVDITEGKPAVDMKDIMSGELFDVPMKPFGGSEDLTWNPNGQEIVYQCKKLSGIEYATSTNSDLYSYNIESGETKNITLGRKGYDSSPQFNSKGNKMAWLSMARDGYESDKNDLIIRDLSTGEDVNITQKWDNTVSTYTWSKDAKKIFFLASINATYQIFEITLPKKLSSIDPAVHFRQVTNGQYNYRSILEAGSQIIALRQDMNNASEIYSVNIKSGEAVQLTHVNDKIYQGIARGKVEKRMVKTTDGKDMLTWVIYPPNFDPAKKHPTLLYCQGGPQSAVSQFYSFRWNFQLMAAAGYIVVAPNRRGLPSFGVEWNEAISKDWGGQAMKDYFSAIDELAKEPYVDENRLGAIGASYGGYSVYMLAGIHENRFKTFISHCGLFNLESWYGTTEELFFANWDIGGAYYQKSPPASYEKHSPHKYVANWNTPMLVFHGGKDFRVPEGQGMEAFNAARQMGLKSRFVYFPEESHWVLSPQNGIIWHSEFFKWLKETL